MRLNSGLGKGYEQDRVPDGELGFEMPRMAPEVIKELLSGGSVPVILRGIDLRHSPKK